SGANGSTRSATAAEIVKLRRMPPRRAPSCSLRPCACATYTVTPAPTPASAAPATNSITEESCAHSATSSAPPRSARTLSSAERPPRPATMIARGRKNLMLERAEDLPQDRAAGADRVLADLLLLLGDHEIEPV